MQVDLLSVSLAPAGQQYRLMQLVSDSCFFKVTENSIIYLSVAFVVMFVKN